MKFIISLLLSLVMTCLSVSAEFRTLVSSDGKTLKAELVSHNGSKVMIRREDGQQFEVDPAIFCKQDHEAILAWMKQNPAKINYRLRVGATKKTEKSTEWDQDWFYEITLRNDGQDSVKDIKIMYRVLYEKWGDDHMEEDELHLEDNLEFNRTLVLKSDSISFSRSKSDRNSGMRGVLVRVLDPKGEVILDWASSDIGMKDVTWESSTPKEPGEAPGKKVEIR